MIVNRRLILILITAVVLVGVTAFGVSQLQGKPQPAYSADVVSALSGGDISGYARALSVRDFTFPADHGAHPSFQTEWWYFTGNLADPSGRRFGFEFTIFRRAIAPTLPPRQSEWATNQIYFADLALSDIGANQFYAKQQFSRGAVGLAGATVDPRLHIWIQDWSIRALDDAAQTLHLQASQDPIALDLTTSQIKPPTLEGDRGLSPKSSEPGNASYYYSLTRLPTQGTLTVSGTAYKVTGNTWMDHEFSTSALGQDDIGWDWFALQLDNNREIMLYRIRKQDGSIEPVSHGTLIEADGSSTQIPLSEIGINAAGQWTSPHTGAVYPAGWHVALQAASGPIQLDIKPLMADQELNSTTAYWEGASQITGTDNGQPTQGYGYVELTGYNQSVSGLVSGNTGAQSNSR
jgi:predicted secreted hydrolase